MKDKAFIKAEDVINLKTWSLPAMKGAIVNNNQRDAARERQQKQQSEQQNRLSVEQLEKIRQQAYDEGYQQGLEEGKNTFLQQSTPLIEQFETLLLSFKDPLELLDENLENQLVNLCLLISKEVIRKEVTTSPQTILQAVQEGLALLPKSEDRVRIRLHPDDASCVRKVYHEKSPQNCLIQEDSSLSQGGCFLEVKSSTINATIEQKIIKATQSLLQLNSQETSSHANDQ